MTTSRTSRPSGKAPQAKRPAAPFSRAENRSPYHARPQADDPAPRPDKHAAPREDRSGSKPARPAAKFERTGERSVFRPAPRGEKSARPERNERRDARPARGEERSASRPAYDKPKVSFGAQISRRASDRLRQGHLWVYASDVEQLAVPEENPPALVPVADNRGLLLGTALFSPASQIQLRMISREEIEQEAWLALLADRLRAAIALRRSLFDGSRTDQQTDSVRLVFSEADLLPGIVLDKYNNLLILQLLTRGLDRADVRETIVRVLVDELKPDAILERPDPRMRELEGMSAPDLTPLHLAKGIKPTAGATTFHINNLALSFDANAGQKTGAFLDQRLNYAAVRDWAVRLGATGRALDVCTYQGGFALHLATVCQTVTGIDASHASLEVAEQNLALNRKAITAEVDWIAADAFQILRDWSEQGERFDTIVLDPPAFAKTRRAVEGALRGYKELNLRALKMLRPGGLLVTCSCSHHVSWTELEESVASAAADAGRRVRILERRGAAEDHPVVLNLAESEYLKCLILRVD